MIRYFDCKCFFCGAREYVELLDAWAGGEFLFATCCEGSYSACLDEMRGDPEFRARLMRELGVEEIFGAPLRRVAACEADQVFRLDFNLRIADVDQAEARAFVDQHHEHNRAPRGWKYGASIWNGTSMIGVVMVGRPVARAYDPAQILEVNRVCIRRDVARELRWNACSQLYGWSAREAKKRGYRKIITYTLESEQGTALRAAGWIQEAKTRGGSWNCPSRPRDDAAPTCPKFRWARILVPAAANQDLSRQAA